MTTQSHPTYDQPLLSQDPGREAEFDAYAEQYDRMLNESIRLSGEPGEYFTEYKIRDLAKLWHSLGQGRQSLQILDFGAGVGASIPSIQRHFPNADLTCADVSARSLRLAEQRFGAAAKFVVCSGSTLPFPDDCFDLAYAACVFHHIPAEWHAGVLRELFRVLKPGGAVLLYEHNAWNPVVVKIVRDCPFDERAILIPAPALKNKLRAAGFERVVATHRVFFPRLLRWLRWLEDWLGWLPLGAQYHVVGRKPVD